MSSLEAYYLSLTEICSWRADYPNPPGFGRESFKHKIKSLGPAGNDDLYDMNTQSGSQVSEAYFRPVE